MSQDVNAGNTNVARENKFRLQIHAFEKVEFECVSASFPSVTLSSARQESPVASIPRPGDKIEYGPLSVRFRLKEDFSNYAQLYEWAKVISGLKRDEEGFPFQFSPVPSDFENRPFSDMTLSSLCSDVVEAVPVFFFDAIPVSIDGPEFTTGNSGMVTVGAQFEFSKFEFRYHSEDA